ncbi:MAG: L,D-transpeptidase family protein [Marinobacter sp.]|uniref:L,D-transpeptidase family protein n=1 Tax=Marinobacter sp. TaxID=50741 RepID=UPI0035696FAC
MIDSLMPLKTLLRSNTTTNSHLIAACATILACLFTLAGTSAKASELPMGAMAEAPEVSEVLVRKEERRLYLLSGEQVVRSYRIGLGDNPSGHKLYEGDKRTPEGEYVLDWRNPDSDFYKSIHISYPNKQDREQASAWGLDPGGSIMIHGLPNDAGDMAFAFLGLDWTDGCIAVSNEEMDEIWQLVADGTPIKIVP